MPPASHTRRYSAFISYRHADNTQEGRRWAEWLHRALERYTVPPDLIGTPNLRGDPIRDSLYPIFRDEDELPANADLATGIRTALEVSDHLIVLCSPRSTVSPWVRKEVREFKELGHSDRILAIIIAGEPNADDPAKAREGILRDEECFCEELRFGAVRDDGTLDWTIRTEPLAADLRPNGTRAEGFVTADAYREHLTLNSSLAPDKIAARVEAYRQQLDHGILKVAAGLLGVPLGQLIDRDAAHRTALAEAEAAKQREIAERERQLAEQAHRSAEEAHRARQATERLARRLAIAGVGALMLALLAGWYWWQAGKEKNEADRQRAAAQTALAESNRQLERSLVEEGRSWLERGRAALNRGDHFGAIMLAGRAVGYHGYGRQLREDEQFVDSFPMLLSQPMTNAATEKERVKEAGEVSKFIESIQPTCLPLWADTMGNTMSDSVKHVVFSPDGLRFASGSLGTIKVWDAETGKNLSSFHLEDGNPLTSIAYSPDGTQLASGSYDSTITIWNAATGQKRADFQGHTDQVRSIAFSPNGTRLVSCSDDETVKLWDMGSGKELANWRGHTGSVAFSPDGERLACGFDGNTVKVWDANTGNEITLISEAYAGGVAFSPDGTYLVGHSGDTIKIWDATKGNEIRSLRHSKTVHEFFFRSGGKHLISYSGYGTIKVWDTLSGAELMNFQLPSRPNNLVFHLAFSPDCSRLACGSFDGRLDIWDLALGKELVSLQSSYDMGSLWLTCGPKQTGLIVGPTGEGHLEMGNKEISLWDITTGLDVAVLSGHQKRVWDVTISPKGLQLASGSEDSSIKLWDIATGRELASLQGHVAWVTNVSFSPDGTRLASESDDKVIKLWDTSTHKELPNTSAESLASAIQWLDTSDRRSPGGNTDWGVAAGNICVVPSPSSLDLASPIRLGLLSFSGRELHFPEIEQSTPMLHVRQDTLAQLANPTLTPERRAELRMELCTKSSQFRAATALWQRLLQGEWPGFEGATVPKDQAPAMIPADSPIRRLYLLALIDATKHPQIHGHPTICQTAAQITPVLTKEMMATPTISLAMMSLMQALAKDDSPDMSALRAALMKRLEEVATKDWLEVLRGE